jgi:hypothetical protein
MKNTLSNLFALTGTASVGVGVWQIEPWACLVLGGVAALSLASALGKE